MTGPGSIPRLVVAINGGETVEFITRFAAYQAVGYLEPHADWNSLMSSAAQDIQGGLNIFGGGLTFFPGDELNFTYANGTTDQLFGSPPSSSPTTRDPLTTGGDFYNYFVLGLLPASFDEVPLPPAFQVNDTETDSGDDSTAADAGPSVWIPFNVSTAAPSNPDVLQQNLGISWRESGHRILPERHPRPACSASPRSTSSSTDIGAFSDAVRRLHQPGRREAKLSQVIIDLQGNSGGLVELAFVTFRQFFLALTPSRGAGGGAISFANAGRRLSPTTGMPCRKTTRTRRISRRASGLLPIA